MAGFALCEKCHEQYANPAGPALSCPAGGVSDVRAGVELIRLDRAECRMDGDRRSRAAAQLIWRREDRGDQGDWRVPSGLPGGSMRPLRSCVGEAARRQAVRGDVCGLMTVRGLVAVERGRASELTSPARRSFWRRELDLRAKSPSRLSPGNHRLGVMLPYTPVHHLLFAELSGQVGALVMTSANLTR